ncbi:MAG: semialdehyde dehydrogenase [Anaerolineales bacterium]|nr:semialdehyde dehydrogenase [Anaerolineales bacterium]
MTTTIALLGAAGKIGSRIRNRMKDNPNYRLLYLEGNEAGEEKLRARGDTPSAIGEAAPVADVAILAVPDLILGRIAHDVVPRLKAGALVICLDPAAPYGGELPPRADIAYFVTHPCHPPIVNDETDMEAKFDFYGGIKAKQHIVCALMQGTEIDYEKGEAIAREIFAPVMNAYRVTVEQMAILEPALSETFVLTCMYMMVEAIDEAVKRGVPYEAARQFILGHMNINTAILFGFLDIQFSDGAKLAVERARPLLFNSNWREIFEPQNVMEQVKAITEGRRK